MLLPGAREHATYPFWDIGGNVSLLDGTATVYANGSRVEVFAGELVFIPPDTVQSTVNNGAVPLRYI